MCPPALLFPLPAYFRRHKSFGTQENMFLRRDQARIKATMVLGDGVFFRVFFFFNVTTPDDIHY